MSPTQRTLKECRRLQMTAAIVERWNPYAKVRQDLFGWIDVLAFGSEAFQIKRGVLGIQTTTGSNAAAREQKIRDWPGLREWLIAGNRAEVWSWRKVVTHPQPGVKRTRAARVRWELDRRVVCLTPPSAG